MKNRHFLTNEPQRAVVMMNELTLFRNKLNFDRRGEFTRIFDFPELTSLGIKNFTAKQVSYSFNIKSGTRRGLHVRISEPLESKCVRPIRGKIFDVILDARPKSTTFGVWIGIELDSKFGDGIVIPGGFAHGIQTLENDTLVVYAMDQVFDEKLDIAINSADQDLAINWPVSPPSVISDKDMNAQNWKNYCLRLNIT